MNSAVVKAIWLVDSVIIRLAAVVSLYWIFTHYPLNLSFFATLAGGFFLGEFLLYWWHRTIYHKAPIFKKFHDEHHRHPNKLIFQTCIITFALVGLVWFGIAAMTTQKFATIILTGAYLTYMNYITVHDLLHHKRFHKWKILRKLHIHHALHHAYEEINFGVSCRLFDKLFGTYRNTKPATNKDQPISKMSTQSDELSTEKDF